MATKKTKDTVDHIAKYTTTFERKTVDTPLYAGVVFITNDIPYMVVKDTNIFGEAYAVNLLTGIMEPLSGLDDKFKEIIHVKIVQV